MNGYVDALDVKLKNISMSTPFCVVQQLTFSIIEFLGVKICYFMYGNSFDAMLMALFG